MCSVHESSSLAGHTFCKDMKTFRYIITFWLILAGVTLSAHSVDSAQMKLYADKYTATTEIASRLTLANDFFAYLLRTGYIDEAIAFPANSHIDSVDVNVYYYVAEWYYGTGDYPRTVDYCSRATHCMGVVDDVAKSDVYGLLGAAYFRMGYFDKAVDALNISYTIDKKRGDFDRLSSTLNGIASVFVAAGKPKEGEKYIIEAIAANSFTDNLSRRAVLYGTASELYRQTGQGQHSLDYARKALDVERQMGDSARIGVRLSQLATAQLGLSMISDAQCSLEEAIPLLLRSGNLHSWGICQNQMGDILAAVDKGERAAAYYLEAAMLFLKQGDKFNELHAREGLYKVLKESAPNEAILHLERAKFLQDSIYQRETSEALAKYNAVYFNDILQQEKERAQQHNRKKVAGIIVATVVLFVLTCLLGLYAYRRYLRKVKDYEQHIDTMESRYSTITQQYNNMVADVMQLPSGLTDDDKKFLEQLTDVINSSAEKGITDINSIATQMHTSPITLRRRLMQTLSLTPKAFILQVRMQKAKSLLQNYRDLTISEVSDRCGYAQLPNFTRAFTCFYGFKPSEMRPQKDKTTPPSQDATLEDSG